MSETVVFLETSLSHQEAAKFLPDAHYLPSIKKGDVLKAIKNEFKRIVIVDGNFAWTPSVWHKEILIALDYGVEVYGASSMGALRAAELEAYGMRGYGQVYTMYKNGVIDGDDEVAIAYSIYDKVQTVALINLRVTLEKLNLPSEETILNKLKHIFYAERTWNKIAAVLTEDECKLIRKNYVDIKKDDAIVLLKHLAKTPLKNKTMQENKTRIFTLFEKKLIESVGCHEKAIRLEINNKGDFAQLLRAKNLIKLLGISKTRTNLTYYHGLIFLLDKQEYNLTEDELMEQLALFREEKNLLLGRDFKDWLIKKHLYLTNLEILFSDFVMLNKYLLISYNYNNYLL